MSQQPSPIALQYLQARYGNQPASYGWTLGGATWGPVTDHIHWSTGNEVPPMPKDKEFSGFDFAVGEVYGIRHWKIDELGRLMPVAWSNQAFWRPGVNVAVCANGYETTKKKVRVAVDPSGQGRDALSVEVEYKNVPHPDLDPMSPYTILQQTAVRSHVQWSDGTTETIDGKLKYQTVETSQTHEVPDENCTCGFYAYSSRENDGHTGAQNVGGIIKGYGRTLIGPKGFRCEKAEIVALIDPTRGGERNSAERRNRLKLLQHVYPDVTILPSWQAALAAYPVEESTADVLPDTSAEDFWKH
jgi:hypothetical protein